jgi:hypothetical protein
MQAGSDPVRARVVSATEERFPAESSSAATAARTEPADPSTTHHDALPLLTARLIPIDAKAAGDVRGHRGFPQEHARRSAISAELQTVALRQLGKGEHVRTT